LLSTNLREFSLIFNNRKEREDRQENLFKIFAPSPALAGGARVADFAVNLF